MEVDNRAWYRRRESVVVRLAEKVRLRPGLQLRLGFGEIGHGDAPALRACSLALAMSSERRGLRAAGERGSRSKLRRGAWGVQWVSMWARQARTPGPPGCARMPGCRRLGFRTLEALQSIEQSAAGEDGV
jgi:hypothetical protein